MSISCDKPLYTTSAGRAVLSEYYGKDLYRFVQRSLLSNPDTRVVFFEALIYIERNPEYSFFSINKTDYCFVRGDNSLGKRNRIINRTKIY